MRADALRSMGAALALAGFAAAMVPAGSAMAAPAAVTSTSDLVLVSVDKARVARIPEKTQTLIIGQPGVADVTMLKNSSMGVITGKSFGETNLIALDAQGNLLGEWVIRVGADQQDLLVQNGMNRESYICAPNCLPTIDLADAKSIAADRASAVTTHTTFSAGK
jgi:Flp pilus assembly secretin CpaC